MVKSRAVHGRRMEHFLGWDSVEELIRAAFPDLGPEPHDRSVSEAVELIHTWALLGDPICQRAGKVSESWVKIGELIRAASELAAAESVTLVELLQASDQRLEPLRDPFCVDFGLHRWLHAESKLSPSDFAHLFNKLDVLMTKWTSLLKRAKLKTK